MFSSEKMQEWTEKLTEIVSANATAYSPKVEVSHLSGVRSLFKTGISIKISQMYEYVKLGFADMQKMADVLGTEKIDMSGQDFTSGCDSCDYGSSYVIELVAYDPKV